MGKGGREGRGGGRGKGSEGQNRPEGEDVPGLERRGLRSPSAGVRGARKKTKKKNKRK